jgi:hypothetical protein
MQAKESNLLNIYVWKYSQQHEDVGTLHVKSWHVLNDDVPSYLVTDTIFENQYRDVHLERAQRFIILPSIAVLTAHHHRISSLRFARVNEDVLCLLVHE